MHSPVLLLHKKYSAPWNYEEIEHVFLPNFEKTHASTSEMLYNSRVATIFYHIQDDYAIQTFCYFFRQIAQMNKNAIKASIDQTGCV